MLKRIHIIGGPGSGKTFIAKKLSNRLNIDCYDLDNLYWHNDDRYYNIKNDPILRDKELDDILKKKSWIIEGVYGSWTKPCYDKADLIVILEPNISLRQWRITRRFLSRKLRLEKSKKKETWKSFFELFIWSQGYYKKKFPGIYESIKPYAAKTIWIKDSRIDIEKLLK